MSSLQSKSDLFNQPRPAVTTHATTKHWDFFPAFKKNKTLIFFCQFDRWFERDWRLWRTLNIPASQDWKTLVWHILWSIITTDNNRSNTQTALFHLKAPPRSLCWRWKTGWRFVHEINSVQFSDPTSYKYLCKDRTRFLALCMLLRSGSTTPWACGSQINTLGDLSLHSCTGFSFRSGHW